MKSLFASLLLVVSVVASAAAPADFPTNAPPNAGLWQVRLQGEWNKTDPIATTEAAGAHRLPGPAMAHLREDRDFRWGGHAFRWKNFETWAYAGYLFMTGGVQYVFGKYFDDSCLLRIDGRTVIEHDFWNEFATGTFVPEETGWHAIEIRLGNRDGNAGPYGEWNGARFGLAFNTAGVKSPTPTSAWTPLRDDTGALLRTAPDDWVPPPLPPPDPAALAAMLPGQLALGGDDVYRVGRDIVHVFRTGGVFRALVPLEARVLAVTPAECRFATGPASPPPPRAPWDLLLALPRPKCLRRLWPQLAALGPSRVYLTAAEKVEQAYWGSTLLDPAVYRPMLLDGLAQAGDTILPQVEIHRRLKPLVEDVLPVRYAPGARLLAHPATATDTAPDAPDGAPGLLAIGPEGGWSDYELRLFEAQGFRRVSFGERILRTDTAVVWAFAFLARPRTAPASNAIG